MRRSWASLTSLHRLQHPRCVIVSSQQHKLRFKPVSQLCCHFSASLHPRLAFSMSWGCTAASSGSRRTHLPVGGEVLELCNRIGMIAAAGSDADSLLESAESLCLCFRTVRRMLVH